MGWKDRYGSSTGGKGGLFVKVGDGESVDFVVHPESEPHENVSKWEDGKSVPCERSDPEARVQVLLGVYVVSSRAKGAKTSASVNDAKILRVTPRTFGDLCDAIDDDTVGGIEQVYRFKRTGSGLETKYSITRIDKAAPELLRAVKGADCPDLSKYGEPMEAREEGTSPATRDTDKAPPEDADIPF